MRFRLAALLQNKAETAFYSFSTSWLIRWHKYNKKTANWRLAVVQSTNSKTESNK